MPWRVDLDKNNAIVVCTYAGQVGLADYKAATYEAIELSREHRIYLVIIDAVELTSTISTMEIYDMPRFYDTTGTRRKGRWAFLMPRDERIRKDAEFYVTVCQNRGWFLRAFDGRRAALEWLLAPSEDDGDA